MRAASKSPKKVDRHLTGQTGEFLVAAALTRLGYSVALPSGNAPNYDLLAYRDGVSRVVQVKCVSTGALQLSLGRFLSIRMDGKRQIITEVKAPSDPNIDFVIVFLGSDSDPDYFLCTKYGSFCGFVVEKHKKALAKYDGQRSENPKNPESLHAGFALSDLKDSPIFMSFAEYFK